MLAAAEALSELQQKLWLPKKQYLGAVQHLGAPSMKFSGQLRNPSDLTSVWFLKTSGSGSRVGVVLPSKCLNYVNDLDLVENFGRK